MNENSKRCHRGKSKSMIKRTSSFENPRQRRSNSLKERVLNRIRKAHCKALLELDSRCQDSQDAFHGTDDSANGTSSLYEDEIDFLPSDDDEPDGNANCYNGLRDFLQRRSNGEYDFEETKEADTTDHEEIRFKVGLARIRRMSFPMTLVVEEEFKQIYVPCEMAGIDGEWIKEKVEVRSSTTQLCWDIESFGEHMPIKVSDSGLSILLFRRYGDNIVAFGLEAEGHSDILYVTAYGNEAGALALQKGSFPSSVDSSNYESDLRFFHKIYDHRSGGIVLKPVFNSDLHLAIRHDDLLSLVPTHTNNDFVLWELESR